MANWSTGGFYRFFGYLNLFMFSMLMLVLANNLLLLFVQMEGVGTCSYLLIGFWFKKKAASDAGKKAFIVNRVGDAGFLLGIFLTSALVGTIRFTEIGPALANAHVAIGAPLVTAIALLFFWAPRENRRRFHFMSGCRTRWKARRRSAR